MDCFNIALKFWPYKNNTSIYMYIKSNNTVRCYKNFFLQRNNYFYFLKPSISIAISLFPLISQILLSLFFNAPIQTTDIQDILLTTSFSIDLMIINIK